jgi:hypothetical protein
VKCLVKSGLKRVAMRDQGTTECFLACVAKNAFLVHNSVAPEFQQRDGGAALRQIPR